MEFVYAVLWTDGALKISDMKGSCQKEKWIPLYTVRTADDPKTVRVICFKKESDAKKFAKANLPREWLKGSVKLCTDEIKWCKDRGWILWVWAKTPVIKNRKDFTIGPEILEFQDNPGVYTNRPCES